MPVSSAGSGLPLASATASTLAAGGPVSVFRAALGAGVSGPVSQVGLVRVLVGVGRIWVRCLIRHNHLWDIVLSRIGLCCVWGCGTVFRDLYIIGGGLHGISGIRRGGCRLRSIGL